MPRVSHRSAPAEPSCPKACQPLHVNVREPEMSFCASVSNRRRRSEGQRIGGCFTGWPNSRPLLAVNSNRVAMRLLACRVCLALFQSEWAFSATRRYSLPGQALSCPACLQNVPPGRGERPDMAARTGDGRPPPPRTSCAGEASPLGSCARPARLAALPWRAGSWARWEHVKLGTFGQQHPSVRYDGPSGKKG